MYKFANGIVVFDEQTKDKMLSAGYKLVDIDSSIEHIVDLSKEQQEILAGSIVEAINENTSNNGTIEEKPRRSKKVSK